MKHVLIVLIALVLVISAQAQDFSYLNDIELNSKEQLKEAEEYVLDCCYYITATRYDKKDVQRTMATSFVTSWLSKSKDLSSVLNEDIVLMTEERIDLEGLYLGCYALNIIENSGATQKDIEGGALVALLDYCNNPINKVKLTKELKRLVEVYEEGQLEAYLRK